jgi:hypothetical protein
MCSFRIYEPLSDLSNCPKILYEINFVSVPVALSLMLCFKEVRVINQHSACIQAKMACFARTLPQASQSGFSLSAASPLDHVT